MTERVYQQGDLLAGTAAPDLVSGPRVALIYAGGGAAGKTTATRTYAEGPPMEYRAMLPCWHATGIRPAPVVWTLYENCGLTGNAHSGTDANTGPGRIAEAFKQVLKYRRVAIVDGMMSSPRWVEMCNDWAAKHPDPLRVVLVHWDLTEEEQLLRLAARRGESVADMPELTITNNQATHHRARKCVEHFYADCGVPLRKLTVSADHGPDDIAAMMRRAVAEALEEGNNAEV